MTIPSIDAMLAQIDRALAPPFRLPAGGPVEELWVGCWGVTPTLHAGELNTVNCHEFDLRENGLCERHHLAIVGTDFDRDLRIAAL